MPVVSLVNGKWIFGQGVAALANWGNSPRKGVLREREGGEGGLGLS